MSTNQKQSQDGNSSCINELDKTMEDQRQKTQQSKQSLAWANQMSAGKKQDTKKYDTVQLNIDQKIKQLEKELKKQKEEHQKKKIQFDNLNKDFKEKNQSSERLKTNLKQQMELLTIQRDQNKKYKDQIDQMNSQILALESSVIEIKKSPSDDQSLNNLIDNIGTTQDKKYQQMIKKKEQEMVILMETKSKQISQLQNEKQEEIKKITEQFENKCQKQIKQILEAEKKNTKYQQELSQLKQELDQRIKLQDQLRKSLDEIRQQNLKNQQQLKKELKQLTEELKLKNDISISKQQDNSQHEEEKLKIIQCAQKEKYELEKFFKQTIEDQKNQVIELKITIESKDQKLLLSKQRCICLEWKIGQLKKEIEELKKAKDQFCISSTEELINFIRSLFKDIEKAECTTKQKGLRKCIIKNTIEQCLRNVY